MNKAKAAVFTAPNEPFQIQEFEVLPAPKGYGRMQLIASGVCGTDMHMWKGRLGATPNSIIGHEFVGKIDDCDAEEAAKYGLKIGDNVIADIAVPCGECILCKEGDDANCANFKCTNEHSIDEAPYLWGGYTEVNFTPLANLIKIPEELDPAMVATFACPGPTAIHAFSLAKRAGIDVSKKKVAVVQGLGPVGSFAAIYLKAIGVEKVYSIVFEKNPDKLNTLKDAIGIDKIFNLAFQSAEEINAELLKENGGLGVDLVFEASGSPKAVPQGMEILRNRGVYLVPGQYSASGGIEIQPQLITFKALQIIGSSQYSVCDVVAYTEFLCAHKEVHETIVKLGSRYPISKVNEAFADMQATKNVKTILVK